jgi:hypothetical protein
MTNTDSEDEWLRIQTDIKDDQEEEKHKTESINKDAFNSDEEMQSKNRFKKSKADKKLKAPREKFNLDEEMQRKKATKRTSKKSIMPKDDSEELQSKRQKRAKKSTFDKDDKKSRDEFNSDEEIQAKRQRKSEKGNAVKPSKVNKSFLCTKGEVSPTKKLDDVSPPGKQEDVINEDGLDISFPRPDALVSVHFSNKHPLSILLEGIAPMLSDCTFNVVQAASQQFKQTTLSKSTLSDDKDRDTFSGMYLEAIDNTHTCIIIGKVKAHVQINPSATVSNEDMAFCVSVSTFLTHVKSIDPDACVQLYRLQLSSDLHIKTFSQSLGRKTRLMTLGTLNKDSETFGVNDINFPHTLEFDLSEFRHIVKFAKNINCDNVRFRILDMNEEAKKLSSKHRSYFIVHIYGENSYDEQCFCSLTDVSVDKDKASTMVIKNSALTNLEEDPMNVCIDDLCEKFNNIFAVEYLNNFLKAVDRNTVTIRLAQDRPMTMTTCMGDSESFLTYMLAPKTDSDSSPNFIQCFAPSKLNIAKDKQEVGSKKSISPASSDDE